MLKGDSRLLGASACGVGAGDVPAGGGGVPGVHPYHLLAQEKDRRPCAGVCVCGTCVFILVLVLAFVCVVFVCFAGDALADINEQGCTSTTLKGSQAARGPYFVQSLLLCHTARGIC